MEAYSNLLMSPRHELVNTEEDLLEVCFLRLGSAQSSHHISSIPDAPWNCHLCRSGQGWWWGGSVWGGIYGRPMERLTMVLEWMAFRPVRFAVAVEAGSQQLVQAIYGTEHV